MQPFLIIVEDDLSGDAIRALLEVHFEEMLAASPPESCHFLDFDGLRSPDVTFWSVWCEGDLAGCGALKQLDASHGEIKDLSPAGLPVYVLAFRDPDNIQLELTAPH